jgi:hypothetical protein
MRGLRCSSAAIVCRFLRLSSGARLGESGGALAGSAHEGKRCGVEPVWSVGCIISSRRLTSRCSRRSRATFCEHSLIAFAASQLNARSLGGFQLSGDAILSRAFGTVDRGRLSRQPPNRLGCRGFSSFGSTGVSALRARSGTRSASRFSGEAKPRAGGASGYRARRPSLHCCLWLCLCASWHPSRSRASHTGQPCAPKRQPPLH